MLHPDTRFPRLYAAASLKLPVAGRLAPCLRRFPRLYAAASLKHSVQSCEGYVFVVFSAALCRGLIEAGHTRWCPPCYRWVFRGFMPRPH